MSSKRENVEILKEAYRLWDETKAGSTDHWMNLMAEEVDFRSLAAGGEGLAFSRDCCSCDDVRRYFDELCSDWEMIHYTPEDFIAEGDRVVMIGSCGWKHRTSGRSVETPKADIFRFKDGKIVSFFEFFDTAQAFAAAQAKD